MKASQAAALSVCVIGGAWLAQKARQASYQLRGRHALITGGSRGLGLALARQLIADGAKVSLVARDRGELDAAVKDLQGRGGVAAGFVCDLTDQSTDPDSIARLINEVENRSGPIDLLINNAGTIVVGPVQSMTPADVQNVMALNFHAAVRTTLAVAPRMAQRGGGRIVNISSVGGKVPVPHLAAYSASKFALAGFFGAARGDLLRQNVIVTTVFPGLMRTGSPRHAQFKGDAQKEYALFVLQDSTPGLSMSAASAARKIIAAARSGRAEVNIGLPVQLAARAYGAAPNATLGLINLSRFVLPSDPNAQLRSGDASESRLTQSLLTRLTRKAELDLNQRS